MLNSSDFFPFQRQASCRNRRIRFWRRGRCPRRAWDEDEFEMEDIDDGKLFFVSSAKLAVPCALCSVEGFKLSVEDVIVQFSFRVR